jgi:hypothetical protein
MNKHILLILFLMCFGATYSQVNCDKFKENFIPKSLEEALSYLDCKWSENDKVTFKSKDENDAIGDLFFGTGAAIRNNWGLWKKKKTSLVKYFNKRGIFHPDDMTGIIFTSFHRVLNNKPIDLNKQIEYYKDYWEKAKVRSDSGDVLRAIRLEKELETYEIGDTVKVGFEVNDIYKKVKFYFFERPGFPLYSFSKPDCYITGIVKEKISKTKSLALFIIDLGGYKEAYYKAQNVKLKSGKTYDFFNLSSYEFIRNSTNVAH